MVAERSVGGLRVGVIADGGCLFVIGWVWGKRGRVRKGHSSKRMQALNVWGRGRANADSHTSSHSIQYSEWHSILAHSRANDA